ncbi:MAG: hypothetical protein ACD_33C00045G0029 [uncultured bacterium]|nr:MAG: hypothetical protein ACD_33C00045G0029 [uncultured bacterium]
MHPYKMMSSRKDERSSINTNAVDDTLSDRRKLERRSLTIIPSGKHFQLKCALLGGSIPVNNSEDKDVIKCDIDKSSQQDIVPVIIVTKCPCCNKITSKETVFMSTIDNEHYYHSFVENSVPGVIKFLLCPKCDKSKMKLV